MHLWRLGDMTRHDLDPPPNKFDLGLLEIQQTGLHSGRKLRNCFDDWNKKVCTTGGGGVEYLRLTPPNLPEVKQPGILGT